ncbi:MAG: histidine phosphatase family protein [Candidatus Harrisonbacteria bacterium]|nr:histidine phosphatase family protein [Candidatus Harrisonbacteria bacterium]
MKKQKESDPDYKEFRKAYEEFERDGFRNELARQLAEKLKEKCDVGVSDPETPLSPEGHRQALETGKGLSVHSRLPDVIFVSPYVRTQQTLAGLVKGWPKLGTVKIILDERIRERNIGLLEIFNDWRILNVLYPEQARLHARQGKFYYRYPQGESIVDVQSRNRQWFQTLTRDWAGKRVLVVSHHLTILSIRSLLERWTPEQFIDVDENHSPKNCSLTVYRGDPKQGTDGKLCLETYNQVFY